MEWLWFELGGRHLAWCRTTGETREGAPPLPGGGIIGEEEDAQKVQQFKFAANSDDEQERGGFGQSWGSADSEYSSSLSSAGDERRNLYSNSKAKESANEERQGSESGWR